MTFSADLFCAGGFAGDFSSELLLDPEELLLEEEDPDDDDPDDEDPEPELDPEDDALLADFIF